MKTPAFYPPNFDSPTAHRTEEFILRPLRTDHVAIDYAALMESIEMLRLWGGGSWPADDFDLEGNLADLAEHQEEHEAGLAYTYTMLDPTEEECLGCVYIAPLYQYLEMADDPEVRQGVVSRDFEAVVRFWVRQPRVIDSLDRRLFHTLLSWLREDWAFSLVYFRVNSLDQRQVSLMQEADLQLHYTLDIPDRNGRVLLYGAGEPVV